MTGIGTPRAAGFRRRPQRNTAAPAQRRGARADRHRRVRGALGAGIRGADATGTRCAGRRPARTGRHRRSATDRVELRGWLGSLRRREWTVPTRLALVRRVGSVDLDLANARFAGPGGGDRTRPGAGIPGPAAARGRQRLDRRRHRLRRQRARPPQGRAGRGHPHVVLTGRVVLGSVNVRGPKRPSCVAVRLENMPVRSALRAGWSHRPCRYRRLSSVPSTRGRRRSKKGPSRGCRPRGHREDARRRTHRGRGAGRGKAVAPGDHRRARPHRPRVHGRPRRLPSTLGYKGFPKSCCTSLNDHLPRHPGLDGRRGRRHRQHRRHRLHQRGAR